MRPGSMSARSTATSTTITDTRAYGEVKRNLGRLIASGRLRPAMPLVLEPVKGGSYQVEMSDESLMTEHVEDCLGVVIEAALAFNLPTQEALPCCSAMLDGDPVNFIARKSLEAPRALVQVSQGISNPP